MEGRVFNYVSLNALYYLLYNITILEKATFIVMDSYGRSVKEMNVSDFGESATPGTQMHKQKAGSSLRFPLRCWTKANATRKLDLVSQNILD